MTIKIEREALLRVIERSPTDQQEYAVELLNVSLVSPSTRIKTAAATEEDTLSVASSVSSCSSTEPPPSTASSARSVSFAPTLVTACWTRPVTPPHVVPDLFYSVEDTHRFRQEYRSERKLQPSYGISRVVVSYQDKQETFEQQQDHQQVTAARATNDNNDSFDFDNESFWSGSITWY